MDFGDVRHLQFLDLSEVEENERIRILASLQLDEPETEFPWFIGHENSFTGAKHQGTRRNIKSTDLSESDNSSINYQNIYISSTTNNIYPNQHYPLLTNNIPVITARNYQAIPTSSINLGTDTNSPVYANYPAPNLHHYSVPATPESTVFQSVYVTYPNAVNSFNQNVNSQYVLAPVQPFPICNTSNNFFAMPASGAFVNHPSEVVTRDFEKSTPETSANVTSIELSSSMTEDMPHDVQESINDQYDIDNTSPEPISCVVSKNSVEEKSDVKASSSSAGGKSWASLFSAKTTNLSHQTAVNGIVKPALTQAVNNKSFNNAEPICPIKNPRKAHFVDPDCYRMGEYLLSYTVDGRTISLQPRGLINQSNYCYINSILQALIACPPVYNLLSGLSQNISSHEKKKPTPVIDGMCRFVKEFKHLPASMRVNNRRSDGKNQQKKDQGVIINTDIPFEPSWIYKMLNGIRTDLIEGRQEDAEEFLGCLLNNLNDEMLELIKLVKNDISNNEDHANAVSKNGDIGYEDKEWQVMGPKNKGSVTRRTEFDRTPISDIFGGLLKSRIHRTGDHITENIQPFFTLPLNIEKVKTVREALEALTMKYQLEGVTSSKTNEEVEAWQQVILDELPVILVLHLKCFDFKLDGCTKIIKALEFPIDLKIDPKLLSSKTNTPKEKQYKLFAVVYHDGKEASKGHYVTDAFHVGYSSWLRYDDASVKPVQEEHVLKPQGTRVPYLLFYRRSDTIRSR